MFNVGQLFVDNMASLRRRKLILFFDSRGRNLEFLVNNMNNSDKIIEPWVFDGATIQDLTLEADYYAQKAEFDVLFIAGGICNITTKNPMTGKISFEWDDPVILASYLVKTMEEAEEFMSKEHPATKFIFCPIPGADLSAVLKKNAEKEQQVIDEAMWIYNEEIFQKNVLKNEYAPNFAEPIHRQIKGIKRTFLQHLDIDGIHLSKSLKEKWAKKIVKLSDRY